MSDLKSFAGFMQLHKLADLVPVVITNLRSPGSAFPGQFADLPENKLYQSIENFLEKIFTALVASDDHNLTYSKLPAWKNDVAAELLNKSESMADIIFILQAKKTAIFSFIADYTNDSSVMLKIVLALESYFNTVQENILQFFQSVQNAEQQKLAESEERYRDLFDHASDMIHIVTPEGKILYVNNAWSNAIGYREDELKGKFIYSFVAEKERTRFEQYRNQVIAGKASQQEIETCFISKSGTEVIAEGSISCRYKDGKPEYTRGILRNITTRKNNEKKLKFFTEELIEREENIRQLIQNAPDAVIVIDEHSDILLWNPKAEQIFGWNAQEVIGKILSDTIIPPQYREAHHQGMKRFLSTGEHRVMNKTIEITALNKEGVEFYISLTISRAKRSGENAFIAFIRDISEQKKNHLELERKRAELEKTNLELEQFAWVASHDLKEPLRKILTFSDMLLTRYELTRQVRETLEKIHGSGTRMNELIKSILLYSNVSDERRLFEPTDLNSILKDVITDLELIIAEKNARINFSSLPTIEAVSFQMRQLFQNLISNSLKYSKPGNIPLIDIASKPLDEKKVVITIRDNGIGFESAYNEKIFQVFQRLSNNASQEGTGIGLALCKKIAETHQGLITAFGMKGEGAIFSIILPYRHM
jgi:PAS domain S-box-containing protein